jgi:hypothetical protein
LDLLQWVQKNLLPSKIQESTCEREGELKTKFEKEKMRAMERNLENLKKKKKKNWRRRGSVRKKERRSEREGDPKKII